MIQRLRNAAWISVGVVYALGVAATGIRADRSFALSETTRIPSEQLFVDAQRSPIVQNHFWSVDQVQVPSIRVPERIINVKYTYCTVFEFTPLLLKQIVAKIEVARKSASIHILFPFHTFW